MTVPLREQRILAQRSGNRCAFPNCRRRLTAEASPPDRAVILGEIAHMVAESSDGPRGDASISLVDLNKYENLILLCNVHHQLIDDQYQTYTIERLQQMKHDHETWVENTLGRGLDDNSRVEALPRIRETVYSTLLPVVRMPRFIYGGTCDLNDEIVASQQVGRTRPGEMAPFILRGGMLLTFQNLNDPDNPFSNLVVAGSCQRFLARNWWDDPDRAKWTMTLMNRALNKLTGRRGLHLDRSHSRYYFQPEEAGQELSIDYHPLNKKRVSRKVVWQPKIRQTGLARDYWYHRVVSLQFLRISSNEWALSIRPELHVTKDGFEVLSSEKIGSKVTRKKSRMFNYDLLGEVQFWRDFLSKSQPRITLSFGSNQYTIISTNLLNGNVTWPGIPEEYAKPFKNVEYVDDLFSWAEFDSDNFFDWLEKAEPLKFRDGLSEDHGLAAIETLDTLDSLLLAAIVEVEQLSQREISADELEERLRQIWQRSYAHYVAQEEEHLEEVFVRRGRALTVTAYPDARQRRKLYKTSLPPRAGKQLLSWYPAFKQLLEEGNDYALWNQSKRLTYIQILVDQLTSLPKFERGEKVNRAKANWREILQWWLNPTSMKKKSSFDASAWYKYVSDNFGYRFNWGLGSMIAVAADEALDGGLLEPSLENWPLLGLPWIALWLKELMIWGTLEPVAAYLLSKNMEITRADAEAAAEFYYREHPQTQDANELLNAATIRDWATQRYSRDKSLPLLRPPDRMDVKLAQDFSKVEARQWRVIPVEVGSGLHWFDPAGILLATSGRPLVWSDTFLSDYDFTLDVNKKSIASENYTTFRR